MTVSELIQILQRFDPNLKVGLYYDCIWQDLNEDHIYVVHESDNGRDEDVLMLFAS